MAVGNPTDIAGMNARLGDCAITERDAARNNEELWGYVASLGADEAGQVAGLVTLGFTPADAQTFWTMANYLHARAQNYYGEIALGQFNYDSGLAGARGPS